MNNYSVLRITWCCKNDSHACTVAACSQMYEMQNLQMEGTLIDIDSYHMIFDRFSNLACQPNTMVVYSQLLKLSTFLVWKNFIHIKKKDTKKDKAGKQNTTT